MVDATPFLPGLSPVQGKVVVARFDGGRLSSEGGLLALREIKPPLTHRGAENRKLIRQINFVQYVVGIVRRVRGQYSQQVETVSVTAR